jgi:predicted aspartyl protease
MDILNALKQLRDDLKTWVTNNLNALDAKIDSKTIPIDSELSTTSTNPVQNKAIAKEINSINDRVGNTSVATQISQAISTQEHFSGDYNDLTNAPNISEDDSGNMVIADESGNIIFKADADGIHTTAVSLNGEAAASEKYVDEAIANIDIPEVDFTGYATEDYVNAAVDSAKEELSESIVAESDEWKVVDEAGNVIFSVDASGAHTTELTLDGKEAATKEYVDNVFNGIEIPEVDFTGYATETYVDNKVADLVNSAPEALNTLGELATALKNHEDAYDALLETVGGKATHADLENLKEELSESITAEAEDWKVVDGNGNIIFSVNADGAHTTNLTLDGQSVEDIIDGKVDKVDGKGLSTNDFTDEYKTKLDSLENITFEETDPTVPAWAKEANKPTYTADEVGALSKDTQLFSGDYNDLENAPDITEDGSGNLIIADEQGNIIL